MPQLPRHFYCRDSVTLAKALLGQRLVRVLDGRRMTGLIVETEAYLGAPDRAAHTFGGRRSLRNASMWLDGGHAYVYFTYGMHYCLNVVAGLEGDPVAVLIRAMEPREGIKAMREHRPTPRRDTDLCSGPAKLCQALAIDRKLDGVDLVTSDALFIEEAGMPPYADAEVVTTARVGVNYAGTWAKEPLRFYLKGNPHVSRK
jgi:DNA-3-methyladenine glycosylase